MRATRDAFEPSEIRKTILLVDDESIVRDIVAQLLGNEGYRIIQARHSSEALTLSDSEAGPIDLLLTDLIMKPHCNGRELAGRIRPSRPGIAVIYMSGFVDDERLPLELEAGLAHFLPKPFSARVLQTLVRKVLAIPEPVGQAA